MIKTIFLIAYALIAITSVFGATTSTELSSTSITPELSSISSAIYPPITVTVTETSMTTTIPTITATKAAITSSNDALRLFTMKSSSLAAIVVLAYLVFLI